MIIEPSNYTYETMPDYTDAVAARGNSGDRRGN